MPISTNTRRPGAIQGWVLVACAWLSMMANQVIAPVLPAMTEAFKDQSHVDLLISLTATFPALFVALLGALFGVVGDRVGYKRVLFAATLFYALFGIAPMWLVTLPQIVVSRALVGIAEAAIMTCSTALIVTLFADRERERYLALQTGTGPIVGVVVSLVGGALGGLSWRGPYGLYAFAFVLLPLTFFFLWDPRRSGAMPVIEHGAPTPTTQSTRAIRWWPYMGRCAVAVFGLAAFLVTAIQMSFVLSERGATSPALIGVWSGVAMMANPVGAYMFWRLRWRPVSKFALEFMLMFIGLGMMALLPSWQIAVVGAVISNLGAGMLLPTVAEWMLGDVPHQLRGRCAGLFISSVFMGQFISPVSIVGLMQIVGTRSMAILVYSAACGVAGIVALWFAGKQAAQANPIVAS